MFDISLDNDEIKAFNNKFKLTDKLSIKIENIAMIRNGGAEDECLPALSSKSIRMIPTLIPFDNGFIEKEQ